MDIAVLVCTSNKNKFSLASVLLLHFTLAASVHAPYVDLSMRIHPATPIHWLRPLLRQRYVSPFPHIVNIVPSFAFCHCAMRETPCLSSSIRLQRRVFSHNSVYRTSLFGKNGDKLKPPMLSDDEAKAVRLLAAALEAQSSGGFTRSPALDAALTALMGIAIGELHPCGQL